MVLNTDDIKKIVKDYFSDKPVNKVWLFGSYARGEADDESDVDVLVDIEKDSAIGLEFFGWPEELKELMRKKVDVVSHDAVNRRLWPYIEKDMTLIYERRSG